jgi:hypothetical protein
MAAQSTVDVISCSHVFSLIIVEFHMCACVCGGEMTLGINLDKLVTLFCCYMLEQKFGEWEII